MNESDTWLLLLLLMAMGGGNIEKQIEQNRECAERAKNCPLRYEVQDMNATIPFCSKTNEFCDECRGRSTAWQI